MLDQRELVLPATGVVNEGVSPGNRQLSPVQACWLADRPHQCGTLHTWQEVLRPVDGLGKPAKPRAMTQELRSHGEHDVKVRRRTTLQPDQDVSEEPRLFYIRLFNVAIPMATSAIAIIVMWRYQITESKANDTRRQLEERRGRLADS